MEEARKMLGELYEEFGLNEVTLKASQLLDKMVMEEQKAYGKKKKA